MSKKVDVEMEVTTFEMGGEEGGGEGNGRGGVKKMITTTMDVWNVGGGGGGVIKIITISRDVWNVGGGGGRSSIGGGDDRVGGMGGDDGGEGEVGGRSDSGEATIELVMGCPCLLRTHMFMFEIIWTCVIRHVFQHVS